MSVWACRTFVVLVEWPGPRSPVDLWELEESRGWVDLRLVGGRPCLLEERRRMACWKELGQVVIRSERVPWWPKMAGLWGVGADRERLPSWVADLAAGMVKVPS